MTVSASLYRFDEESDNKREVRIETVLDELTQKEGPLRCAACRAIVTTREAGITMHGIHDHWFTNPHGFSFHIGCFEDAPGCSHIGSEVAEHSWFPGYVWTVALCAICGTHLGWRFRGIGERFYGLILDRLVSSKGH